MNIEPNSGQSSVKKVLIAKTLLWVATVAAFGVAISAISAVIDAPASTKVVEAWRMLGFAAFAGLFAVLATRPTGYLPLWLIVISNKLALTLAGVMFLLQGDVDGSLNLVIFDGGLTVLLVVAFAMSRWPVPKKPLGEPA